jgi:hypothetical protein
MVRFWESVAVSNRSNRIFPDWNSFKTRAVSRTVYRLSQSNQIVDGQLDLVAKLLLALFQTQIQLQLLFDFCCFFSDEDRSLNLISNGGTETKKRRRRKEKGGRLAEDASGKQISPLGRTEADQSFASALLGWFRGRGSVFDSSFRVAQHRIVQLRTNGT